MTTTGPSNADSLAITVPPVKASSDQFRYRSSIVGLRQHGHALWKVCPALGCYSTLEEKFADAAQVNQLPGASPSMATHVLWDFPNGRGNVAKVRDLSRHYGIRAGAINPNLFEGQQYKFGSFGNPDPAIRQQALDHVLESVAIAQELDNADVSLWFADGSNYPGTQNIRHRIDWFQEGLSKYPRGPCAGPTHVGRVQTVRASFYHTDIADWGMALLFARAAGPQAFVLVDTGHHYQAQNIEQILAWLQREKMLGGFHFNDRRYADDDLTLGSIDPYQVFRLFHEILSYHSEHPARRRQPISSIKAII